MRSLTAGRVLDAQFHLLDRQVLDVRGVPVTTVDDLELSDITVGVDLDPRAPAPVLESLLSGAVLATRIFGGRPPDSRWHRIPWSSVATVETAIGLSVSGNDLEVTWPERWVSEHVIGKIPGGKHDPE